MGSAVSRARGLGLVPPWRCCVDTGAFACNCVKAHTAVQLCLHCARALFPEKLRKANSYACCYVSLRHFRSGDERRNDLKMMAHFITVHT